MKLPMLKKLLLAISLITCLLIPVKTANTDMLIASPVLAEKYNCVITFDQEPGEITGITGILHHDYASLNNDATNSTMCAINWFNFNLTEGKNFLEIVLYYYKSTLVEYCQIRVRWGLDYIAETERLPLFETYDYALYLYPHEGFKVQITNAETNEVLILKRVYDSRVLSIRNTMALQHYFDSADTYYFKACSTIQWQFVKIDEMWHPAIEVLIPQRTYEKTNIPGGYMEIYIWHENNYWNVYYRTVQTLT